MAKKPEPILTHTEILCRAIRNIEDEIKSMEKKIENLPIAQAEDFRSVCIEPLLPKLEALKQMYRIETGTDYE